jgi:hypothetical protein
LSINPFAQKILDAHNDGRVNDYMKDRLLKATEFGVNEQLLDDALSDAESASKMDIKSDQDYAVRFCILNLADDLMDDTFGRKIDDDERNSLVQYVLQNQEDKYLKDLVGLRIITYKWLCDKHNKKAYPNTYGMEHQEPTYNTNKWAATAKKMYMLMRVQGLGREDALMTITKNWDMDEKFKFDNWLRYYESGNTEKYNVKTASTTKEALLPSDMVEPTEPRSNVSPSFMAAYKIKEKEEHRKEKERREKQERADLVTLTKRQMKSRLKSLWNLVHRFNDLLPKSSVDDILNLIHHLDVSISRLQTEASVRDCMVRTANQIRKVGFDEGADLLMKIAEEPVSEKVIESIEPIEQKTQPNIQVSTIISRLEVLGKMLKARDLVRNLASIDILLNELGMASLFPELGDSQSKLNDAFGYASTKIDGIISKLRGAGKVKPLEYGGGIPTKHAPKPAEAPIPAPPAPMPTTQKPEKELRTEELRESPVGEVKTELPRG